MSMRSAIPWQRLALFIGTATLFWVAYGPVLMNGPFGISDDYQTLYRVHTGTFDPAHNEQIGMGRFVASWGFEGAYALCDGKVARLVWLRAFALAGVVLFACTLRSTLTAAGFSGAFAGTVAALVALSPASAVYAAWAAALFSPFALTAALLAGRLLIGPLDRRRELAGGMLLLLACATWQAAAPMALFPALAEKWHQTGTNPASLIVTTGRRWWRPWLVSGITVVLYAMLCWLTFRLGLVSGAGTERLSLATNVPAKVWLLGDLLRSGMASWARMQPGRWEWGVALLNTGACLGALIVRENGRMLWSAIRRRTGIAVVMLMLSVVPMLAARENNAALRTLPMLYTVVAFLGAGGLSWFLTRRPAWMRVGVPLAVVAASAGVARYHVWHGLVEPNVREYVGLRDQIRAQFPAGPPARLVYLLPPPTLLADGRLTPAWEYGTVSSSFWWVTRPFLLLLFEETAPQSPQPPAMSISYREAGNPGVPVLNPLPSLLRESGSWRDDPLWGPVCAYRRGWLYSPWFGYLNVEKFPLIQHYLLGPLIHTSQVQDKKDLWFYHEGIGQFYTGPGVFPYLFLGASKRWVTLSDDNPAVDYLDDPTTKERVPYPR